MLKWMVEKVTWLKNDKRGFGIIEIAIILALIFLLVFTKGKDMFQKTGDKFDKTAKCIEKPNDPICN